MARNKSKHKRRTKKIGASPGTLVHLGEQKVEHAGVSLIQYSADELVESTLESLSSFSLKSDSVAWLNIDGLHDVSLIEELGHTFDIHNLVLEDCLNSFQRPKIDIYDEYLFVVMKMLYLSPDGTTVEEEQVSFILGSDYLITLQERPGDVFSAVRDRLRLGKGRIRKLRSDYLLYALMDVIVDHYLGILDEINDRIDGLDQEVLSSPEPSLLQNVYHLKRQIMLMRRRISPLREVVSRLTKGDTGLVAESTLIYIQDVYDHLLQVIESIDIDREIVTGLIELYVSSVSNKMNEIMKVLTVLAAIFIPLTFIVGVYGMNFDSMPELRWRYGYEFVWGLLLLVAGGMLLFFRKKKWL